MLKKLMNFLFLTTIFIVSYSGNLIADDSKIKYTTEEIEKILNLPPPPNEDENNSTVLGIDSNDNDIRDDIERHIGLNYYPNIFEINALNEIARSGHRQIKAYQSKDWDSLNSEDEKGTLAIGCIIDYRFDINTSTEDLANWAMMTHSITALRLNTLKRAILERKMDAKSSDSGNLPSTSYLKQYCPRFEK